MTSRHLYSTGEENYKGLFIEWIEDWSQFFMRCNWYTFRPILIELEDDRCMGGVEFTLIVLGLGTRIRWNYAETEKLEEIRRLSDEIMKDGGVE